MKKIQPIRYICATGIDHACREGRDGAVFLAGGTDLLVAMKEKGLAANKVVDLKAIQELTGIEVKQGECKIGAMATIHSIASSKQLRDHYPQLPEAAVQLGSYQVRNRATIGGNLCNASPSAEMSPGMLVMDAVMEISNGTATRKVPADTFFLGPGRAALLRGEILTAVRFAHPSGRYGVAYEKFGPRNAMDIALVGVSALLELHEDGTCKKVRIALGAVAPVPKRAIVAESILTGQRPSVQLFEKAAIAAANEDCQPIDDQRASAAYRRELVQALTLRALQRALCRSGKAEEQC